MKQPKLVYDYISNEYIIYLDAKFRRERRRSKLSKRRE